MKKLLSTLFLAVALFSADIVHAEKNLRRYLELEGKIFQTGFDAKGTQSYMDSALIVVVNTVTGTSDSLFSGESGAYIFRLPLNNDFMITVSRSGFVSKRLHVNTQVPLFTTGYYGIEFELDLYKSISGLDVSALLDQPIADISFHTNKKSFDYDRAYTDQVNRGLKKMYTAYYLHRLIPIVTVKKPVAMANGNVSKRKGKALRISSGKIRR